MSLREDINFLVSQVLLEIRGDFKWDEFKEMKGPINKQKYVERTGLEKLGQGSSRAAYILSNRYVLKLALPRSSYKKGIAQNKFEAELAADESINHVLAGVYDHGEDYSWMVSEIVRPLSNFKEFTKLAGVRFYDLLTVVEDVSQGKFEERKERVTKKRKEILAEIDELEKQAVEFPEDEALQMQLDGKKKSLEYIQQDYDLYYTIPNHPTVAAIMNLVEDKGLAFGDITRISHWGKTADGRAVILDYGLSKDIASKMYGYR